MDLSTPVQFIPGVGPVRAKKLGKLGIVTVEDLLWHVPRSHVDRSTITPVAELIDGDVYTSRVEVRKARSYQTHRKMRIFEVEIADDSGMARAIWFNQPYLSQSIKAGVVVLLHGKVGRYRNGQLQFQSPEYEVTTETNAPLHGGRVVALYPLTAGVTQKQMRHWVQAALEAVGDELEDPLPLQLRTERKLNGLRLSFEQVHFPDSLQSIEEGRRRLAFEEFFALQIALGWVKSRRREAGEVMALPGDGELETPFRAALPFTLTAGQEKALAEIRADLATTRPMSRLLQGDVGSGKTVVAALAAMTAIESGAQVAYMAPTEILALQQAESFRRWLTPLGRRAQILIGRTSAAERKTILGQVGTGSIDVLVGTHALLEDTVHFRQLGLVIVDEQHRFGVLQRGRLLEKGTVPHCLVMSATPIPRTLNQTLHGDLDLSLMTEMPPGRIPPESRMVPPKKREDLYRFTADLLREGERAFFIYPLVEESEQVDLKDATNMAAELSRHPAFEGIRIGLLHGRMRGEEKADAIARLRDGTTPCLVTTTVVEVGVDVPEATVMVVEHPERFGLSQLHQLRGRVGRGGGTSYFFMLARGNLSPESYERLQVMVRESNGFRVAEEDLRLRGPGDLLGTEQSGLPSFRVGDLIRDPAILEESVRAAAEILRSDPELTRYPALKNVVERRYGNRFEIYKIG